jgi:predicted nucleotidyltransferase
MKNDTQEIIEYLRANKKVLRDKFGVTRLGVFGSVADQRIQDNLHFIAIWPFQNGMLKGICG